jgi:hypothetical protein
MIRLRACHVSSRARNLIHATILPKRGFVRDISMASGILWHVENASYTDYRILGRISLKKCSVYCSYRFFRWSSPGGSNGCNLFAFGLRATDPEQDQLKTTGSK